MKIDLEIVAPNALLASEQVDEIVIPAAWGQMDILPQYADFVTTLTAGELIYRKGTERKAYQITGGLLTIAKDKATILVDGLAPDRKAMN
jgi:F-type H+-transporting ATPase subunit epsilon